MKVAQCFRWHLVFLLLFSVLTLPALAEEPCKETYGDGSQTFRIATGSPGELGLVAELAKAFNENHDAALCWVKAGSGKSLKLLKAKAVDGVLVHAPAAEKKAIDEGWAVKRTLIGSNEFYIVGPSNDPAGISKADTAPNAYKRIAETESKFLSRGDNSGTHKKEMMVWDKAGIDPQGDWYIVTNDFMMGTLKKANAEGGYFMTDSSTWVAAQKDLANLKVLFRGDPMLINTYHGLAQPEGATPGQPLALKFVEFVGSDKGQEIIGNYGKEKHGAPLYNDAAYAEQYAH